MNVFDTTGNYEDAYSNLSTYGVRKFTRKRQNKHGFVKIEIEILKYEYLGEGKKRKERKFIDTGVWVNPKNWSNKKQTLSPKEEDYPTKFNKINKVFAAVQGYVSSKGQQDIDQVYIEDVSFDNMRKLFPSRKQNRKGLVEYLDEYYEFRKQQGDGHTTAKEFRTVTNRVKAFDAYRGRKSYFEDITIMWSNDFNLWMKKEKKYTNGTIGKCYTTLYTMLNYYYEIQDESNEYLLTDKFKAKLFRHGEKSVNEPNPLTKEQVYLLYNHGFKNEKLEKTRKMVLLQCRLGCRHIDLDKLRPEHFYNKNTLLKFQPSKTKKDDVIVIQPLNRIAQELLKEVNYDTSEYKLSNQKYNDYISEVLEAMKKKYPDAAFKTDHTSHNFRDTFISMCVNNGVNFKSILQWVGQSSYQVMDRYVKLDDEFNAQEMKKLEEKKQVSSTKPDLSKVLRIAMDERKGDIIDIDDIE
jgi:integrase